MKMNSLRHASAIFLTSMVIGCSTIAPPSALKTHAKSEIQIAKEAGAENYAPLAFRSATQHFDEANSAMDKEDYQEAKQLLEKAIVDANYANAKAQSEKSQKASKEINANLEELKKAL